MTRQLIFANAVIVLVLAAVAVKVHTGTTASAAIAVAAPVATVTVSTVSVAAPSPPPAAPSVDALHQYAIDAILTLKPAYAELKLETAEARKTRWVAFANEVADAVQTSSKIAHEDQAAYVITLIWIAHRETVLAMNPFNVGNCDEGTSLGPWSMKEWRGVDRYHAAGALKLLLEAPGAWSLPSKPWLGLVYDKRLGRPSASSYLAAHPL